MCWWLQEFGMVRLRGLHPETRASCNGSRGFVWAWRYWSAVTTSRRRATVACDCLQSDLLHEAVNWISSATHTQWHSFQVPWLLSFKLGISLFLHRAASSTYLSCIHSTISDHRRSSSICSSLRTTAPVTIAYSHFWLAISGTVNRFLHCALRYAISPKELPRSRILRSVTGRGGGLVLVQRWSLPRLEKLLHAAASCFGWSFYDAMYPCSITVRCFAADLPSWHSWWTTDPGWH